MSIRVGICGVGSFAGSFIPLFHAHPEVSELILCDLDEEKLRARSAQFSIASTCPSLDELCQMDVDAIAIFSQNWMHGPQAAQALRSGKHVYSAVPSATSVDEMAELVKAVEDTGQIYMVGETSYYYPTAIYCRERFQKGDFGRIVYAEGEYYHDYDHGLYTVMQQRGGEDWRKFAGGPPMYYPTHSTSMIVSVTGAHMTHVSCLGWVDQHEDGLFQKGVNIWDNVFSNESALFRMSDGSIARINEFRRIGHHGGERINLYGTQASFEEQSHHRIWVTKNHNECVELNDLLLCTDIPAKEAQGDTTEPDVAEFHRGVSQIHPVNRLPKEFVGLGNGHNGSHQFLVHDFVTACISGETPPNNVWDAARYLVPGLIAHESAVRQGELMEVPDFGDTP